MPEFRDLVQCKCLAHRVWAAGSSRMALSVTWLRSATTLSLQRYRCVAAALLLCWALGQTQTHPGGRAAPIQDWHLRSNAKRNALVHCLDCLPKYDNTPDTQSQMNDIVAASINQCR